jgi:hypothetical protein
LFISHARTSCTLTERDFLSQRHALRTRLLEFRIDALETLHDMNDPGLDEPAQEAAQDVENNMQAEDDQAEQEEREYLDPSYVLHCGLALHRLTSAVNGGLHLQLLL